MRELALEPDFAAEGKIGILFSPNATMVIDVFRALGDFEDHYDIAALDFLEEELSAHIDRICAKGMVSDALLLAFGLRRERETPLVLHPLHSRRGSLDEYRLYAMIASSYWHDETLATLAAEALGIAHPNPLLSLAYDVARRLESAQIRLDLPSERLLTASSPEGAGKVILERSLLHRPILHA